MKKIIIFLCLAALLLPFVCMTSCGNNQKQNDSTQSPDTDTDPNEQGGENTDPDADTDTDTDTDADADGDWDGDTDSDSDDDSDKNGDPDLPPYSGPAYTEKVPSIYIATDGGAEIPENKEEVNCLVSLRSNKYSQCADDLAATIRCRGNGSMTVGKKVGKYPYKIQFRGKVNPFDLGDGKAKDWVLLAHVGDQSMLRNYAAKILGDMMSGIPFSCNARLVNVYLNDEYIGVYELTEQVEVGDSRIDIRDNLSTPENGFLVELDAYASGNYVRVGGQRFTVKSEVYSEEQLAFIEDYLQQVDDAIYAGDKATLEQLVDMNSVVDMYIVQEFAKNIDVGWSSFYMYRDVGGKLTFAPPWDFDLSFGNDARLDGGSYEGLYVGPGGDIMQDHVWYNALYEWDWFRDLVASRWRAVSNTLIVATIRAVRNAADEISADMEKNYEKWKLLGKKQQQEPREVYSLTTYKAHIDYLIDWMENRKAWLDSEF